MQRRQRAASASWSMACGPKAAGRSPQWCAVRPRYSRGLDPPQPVHDPGSALAGARMGQARHLHGRHPRSDFGRKRRAVERAALARLRPPARQSELTAGAFASVRAGQSGLCKPGGRRPAGQRARLAAGNAALLRQALQARALQRLAFRPAPLNSAPVKILARAVISVSPNAGRRKKPRNSAAAGPSPIPA